MHSNEVAFYSERRVKGQHFFFKKENAPLDCCWIFEFLIGLKLNFCPSHVTRGGAVLASLEGATA